MNLPRAIVRFITSEVLLPIVIVCLSVLIAAQFLPMLASNLSGEFEQKVSPLGTTSITTVAGVPATKVEQ